jgi:putative tRNA adenosine deaminase-associated protein
VSYFTAVLVRDHDKWFARDVDLEDIESLDDLADTLRALEADEEPVLAFIEREDAWWAVVRVDGDEDPRIFISDAPGAAASTYAHVLEVDSDGEDDEVPLGGWAGDPDVLADLGTSPEDLQQMCEDELIPMDALAAVAEAGGFAEVLDSLR